jgi:hypothetical protein
MRKYTFLLLLVFIFMSCNDDKIIFEVEKHAAISALPCDVDCTAISIQVAIASGGFVADSINQVVFDKIKDAVYFGEAPLNASEYVDIMDSFIKAYDDFRTAFPEDLMVAWEANVSAENTFESEQLIQLKMDIYTFTGGAHGISVEHALSFDPKSGKQISVTDFFTDLESVKKLATQKFRNQFKIPANQTLAQAGFFFQQNDFVLPENVFFTKDGITFHYNVYEIASYAQGSIQLEFTYQELDSFLKIR